MNKSFQKVFGKKIDPSYDELNKLKNHSYGNILARNRFDKMINQLNRSFSGERIKYNILTTDFQCTADKLERSLGEFFAEGTIDRFQIAVSPKEFLPLIELYLNGDSNFNGSKNKIYYAASGGWTNNWFSYHSYLENISLEKLIKNAIFNRRDHCERYGNYRSSENISESQEEEILSGINSSIPKVVEPFIDHCGDYIFPLDKNTSEIFGVLRDAEIHAVNNYLSLEASRVVGKYFEENKEDFRENMVKKMAFF